MISGDLICDGHFTANLFFIFIIWCRLDQVPYHLRRWLITFLARSDYLRLWGFLLWWHLSRSILGFLLFHDWSCIRAVMLIVNEQSRWFLLLFYISIFILVIRLYRARINVNLADLGIIGVEWAYITKLGRFHAVTLAQLLLLIPLRSHLHTLLDPILLILLV